MRIAICALIYIRFGVFYMSLKMTYYIQLIVNLNVTVGI